MSRRRAGALPAAVVLSILAFVQLHRPLAARSDSLRQHPSRLVSVLTMGSLPTGDTFEEAARYFASQGRRSSSQLRPGGVCVMSVPSIGLRLVYFGDVPDSGPTVPSTCTSLHGATVTGPSWHTSNGLRVGSSRLFMMRKFPKSVSVDGSRINRAGPLSGTAPWFLTRPPGGIGLALVAYVRDSLVVGLEVASVGH